MTTTKRLFLLAACALLAAFCVPVLAAASTAVAEGSWLSPLLEVLDWHALIAVAVPVVLAGLKKLVDRLPPRWLPLLATLLGMVADALVSLSTGGEVNVLAGAAAGLLGVGLREFSVKLVRGESKDRSQLPPRRNGSGRLPP